MPAIDADFTSMHLGRGWGLRWGFTDSSSYIKEKEVGVGVTPKQKYVHGFRTEISFSLMQELLFVSSTSLLNAVPVASLKITSDFTRYLCLIMCIFCPLPKPSLYPTQPSLPIGQPYVVATSPQLIGSALMSSIEKETHLPPESSYKWDRGSF